MAQLYAFYSQGIAWLGTAFAAQELPIANTVFVMVYRVGNALISAFNSLQS